MITQDYNTMKRRWNSKRITSKVFWYVLEKASNKKLITFFEKKEGKINNLKHQNREEEKKKERN